MTVEVLKKYNAKYPLWLADMVEDDNYYINMVEKLLDINGITNRRKFVDTMQYEQALKESPKLTPHIALVDYSPNYPVTGLDITRMLMKRAKEKLLKPRVIMITHYEDFRAVQKFLRLGGSDWVNKMDEDAEDQVKAAIQHHLVDIQEAYAFRGFLDEIKEDSEP